MNPSWFRIAHRLALVGERIKLQPKSFYGRYRPRQFTCLKDFQGCFTINPIYVQSVRTKYNKLSSHPPSNEEESDSDEELGDFKDEPDGKVIKTSVKSLRLDLIVKSGLGLARNKVENIFYENKIRVNGEKISKKSMQLKEGDEIDVVKGFSTGNTEHLQIARVQLLAASEKEEGYRVAIRRFKSIVVENYPGQNAYKSSS